MVSSFTYAAFAFIPHSLPTSAKLICPLLAVSFVASRMDAAHFAAVRMLDTHEQEQFVGDGSHDDYGEARVVVVSAFVE